MNDNTVIINLNGTKFEIKHATYNRLIQSSELFKQEAEESHNKNFKEILLEQHAQSFDAILLYFQNGDLHMPPAICPGTFRRELEYWGVGSDRLAKCCRHKFVTFEDDFLALAMFDNTAPDHVEAWNATKRTRWVTFRTKVWNILDVPASSKLAKVYLVLSVIVIALSIFSLCLSTTSIFQRDLTEKEWKEALQGDFDKYKTALETKFRPKGGAKPAPPPPPPPPPPPSPQNGSFDDNATVAEALPMRKARVVALDYIDMFCLMFYTAELMLRLIFCPSLKNYFRSVLNIIDILATLSMYGTIIVNEMKPEEKFRYSSFDFLQLLNILRTARLFRLIKDLVGFRVLTASLKSSFKELFLLSTFLFIATIIFGSLLYFSEDESEITSIPHGCWWAIITMTTVGYGDVSPKSVLGMMIGALCAMSGVLLIAIVIPVFVNNFMLFYTYAKCAHIQEQEKKVRSINYTNTTGISKSLTRIQPTESLSMRSRETVMTDSGSVKDDKETIGHRGPK